MLKIVWKHKHQREHGTFDKNILTPPSIRICPLFGELKKGDFFTPLPPIWTNVSFSAIFFFERIPYSLKWNFLYMNICQLNKHFH